MPATRGNVALTRPRRLQETCCGHRDQLSLPHETIDPARFGALRRASGRMPGHRTKVSVTSETGCHFNQIHRIAHAIHLIQAAHTWF